jgi:hypothetical protein
MDVAPTNINPENASFCLNSSKGGPAKGSANLGNTKSSREESDNPTDGVCRHRIGI